MIRLGRLEVETPDHVVLRYDLAGGGNRGFAALVDVVVASLIVAGLVVAWSLAVELTPFEATPAVTGIAVLALALIAWSYFVVLEWLWQGQTLGKRMFGLRVIRADGSPAGFVAVLVRNVVRVVDFLPAFYGLGLLAIVVSSRSQRLGDLAAGTFVVRAPRPRLDPVALRTGPRLAEGAAADVRGLPGELQRLVREFVAREAGLAERDRRAVAARIAAALRARIEIEPGTDDVEAVRAVARALRSSAGAGTGERP